MVKVSDSDVSRAGKIPKSKDRASDSGATRSPAELAARMREQKDAQTLAGEAIDATRNAVNEGNAIVQRARDDFALSGSLADADIDSPAVEAWKQAGSTAPLLAPLNDIMTDIIGCVVSSEQIGRKFTAAMALASLRERYEAIGAQDLPADERDWAGFSAKHVPLPAARVTELIGMMVHAGGLIRCSRCASKSKAECGCGAPYVGTHRWATSIGTLAEEQNDREKTETTAPTALDRAMAAVAANPEKSNRALAAEIGCNDKTIAKARRIHTESAVESAVDERVGRDGRRRQLPGRRPPPPISNPVKEVNAFHGELIGFLISFSERFTAWRESDPPLDAEGKAALMQALYLCGDGIGRLAQELDGR